MPAVRTPHAIRRQARQFGRHRQGCQRTRSLRHGGPKADCLLRVNPGIPRCARAPRVGLAPGRASRTGARGAVGRHGRRHRRRGTGHLRSGRRARSRRRRDPPPLRRHRYPDQRLFSGTTGPGGAPCGNARPAGLTSSSAWRAPPRRGVVAPGLEFDLCSGAFFELPRRSITGLRDLLLDADVRRRARPPPTARNLRASPRASSRSASHRAHHSGPSLPRPSLEGR